MMEPALDLEVLAARLRGHYKLNSLLHIARGSSELSLEAYRLAYDEVNCGKNTSAYRAITDAVNGRLGDRVAFDQNWVDTVEKRAVQHQEKCESDLNAAKSALIKESIRMGHNDLGDFHYDRGDLNLALKSFVRTRDYCTTSKHHIQMCLNVIKVSIELSNYAQVSNYVTKAEQNLGPKSEDVVRVTKAKLRCAMGLSHLDGKRYKQAALAFTEVPVELSRKYNNVITCEDVALFGGLCALATLTRPELKARVIESSTFKSMLELTPRVRELVRDFYASKYSSCLLYLAGMRAELELSLYLGAHVREIYEKIRHRALIQYVSPYTAVNLDTMAEAFNVSEVADLEKEIADLIMAEKIQARIDSHKKVLFARHADQRNITYRNALEMGERFAEETQVMLLRMALIKNGFVHKSPRVHEPSLMAHSVGSARSSTGLRKQRYSSSAATDMETEAMETEPMETEEQGKMDDADDDSDPN